MFLYLSKFIQISLLSGKSYNPRYKYDKWGSVYNVLMYTKAFALLLTTLGALSVIYHQDQIKPEFPDFKTWKLKFGISYDSMLEDAYRERIFMENLVKMEIHNRNKHNTYQMGVNQFSALTEKEFSQIYLGTIIPTTTEMNVRSKPVQEDSNSTNWILKGDVTPVKFSGQCGSFWAFSAVGALESLNKIKGNNLALFSEQQLIDCSGCYGNLGCNGGSMAFAYDYVIDHGIALEIEYPYKAVLQLCKQYEGDFKISGYKNIINDKSTLVEALKKNPISVAVDAAGWMRYQRGIFSCLLNQNPTLNHAVLLVGYESNIWIVKNSWGTSWGEDGYMRIANEDNTSACGLWMMASYPEK